MSKLLSKITITVVAIAGIVVGTFYFTSTSRGSNSAVANDNRELATLVSVWDKETEPDYSGTTEMTVYRSPSCGCCGVWVEHALKHGFKIEDIKTDEMEALKQKHNIPSELASCHTTIIDGYVMEGHIPADDIKRFLTEKPQLAGLAVPGMPIGTPGMEARDIKQPFQVLAFNNKGEVEVFKEYQSY
ncbi:putative metal-binding protein [Hyella patelloides LEGE 07179]|uniref:Putative metal-binding protein n=1 Tax=Hyella patelloides LEGE 07179 TaxID=945734 RepID=A0A563VW81_9CYAN|nr:DUF411 domain-containing protein [Hyella patelloides]VEP15647.1 putative metal-binding protein [Hyella patelloides LEGE 07179]